VTPFHDDLTGDEPRPMPAQPCDAPIGSAERVACYAARAERGEALHHPDDSRAVADGPDNRRGVRGSYEKRTFSEAR